MHFLEDKGVNNKKTNLGKFTVNVKFTLLRDEVINHCNNIASVVMDSLSLEIF